MALGSTLATERKARGRFIAKPRAASRRRMTPRLKQVAELLSQGLTMKAIAGELGLTEGTAKVYAHDLYRLTGLTRMEMITRGAATNVNADGNPRMGVYE